MAKIFEGFFKSIFIILLIITLIFEQNSYGKIPPDKKDQNGLFDATAKELRREKVLKQYDYDCKDYEIDHNTHRKAKLVAKGVNKLANGIGNSVYLGFKGLIVGSAYIVVLIGRFLNFQTYGITSVVNILFYIADIILDLISTGILHLKAGIDAAKSLQKIVHIFERNHLEYFHLNSQCLESEDQLDQMISGSIKEPESCDELSLKKRLMNAINFLNPHFLKKKDNCEKGILDYGKDYKREKRLEAISLDPFLWALLWSDESPLAPNLEYYKLDGPKKCLEISAYGHKRNKKRREHYLYYLAYQSTPFRNEIGCMKHYRYSIPNNIAKVNDFLRITKIGTAKKKINEKKKEILNLKKQLVEKLKKRFLKIVVDFKDQMVSFAKSHVNSENSEEKAFSEEVLQNEAKLNSEEEILKAAEELAQNNTNGLFTEDDLNIDQIKNYLGFFDKALSPTDVQDICIQYRAYFNCRNRMVSKIKTAKKVLKKMGLTEKF